MRRLAVLAVLGLGVLPGTSRSLQLTWMDGGRNLTVTSTAVCTLLVRPSPSLAPMPPQWRLVYVGASSVDPDSALVFLDSPGPAEATPPCAVDGPATDADREAHLTTIAFCSPDGEPTTAAAFIVRVDPSLRARIAAVASSSRFPGAAATISSDAEVTINGGCAMPYPPVVWAANQSLDAGGHLQLVLEGVGLDHVQFLVARPGARATSRSRPARAFRTAPADTLTITSRTSRGLTAALTNPLPLGETVILSGGSDRAASAITVTPQQLPSPLSSVPTMFPPYPYRPKDFAFIYAQGLFHLFYIRHDINAANDDSTEVDFGHATSLDLMNWSQLPPILHVRPAKWDNLHVWAPSIISKDGIYYFFYTGVTYVPYLYKWYQRVGVATSDDVNSANWLRYDAPVLEGDHVPWVFADSTQFAGCQFRDPFVMADSSQSTWLMYYSATPRAATSQLITGIATNATGLAAWQDLKPMWNTDAAPPHYRGDTESPHVFEHAGCWYLFFTTNSGHPIRYQYSTVSATADSAGWIGTWRLYDDDPTTDAWCASEFLRVGPHEYFAAVNSDNNGIEIREMKWTGATSFTLSTPSVVAAPNTTEESEERPSVATLGSGRGGAVMRFRVDLPSAMRVDVGIYDVVGRRIRGLHTGELAAGATVLAWDKKDDGGRELGTGVYFVRLGTPLGARSAKVALLR